MNSKKGSSSVTARLRIQRKVWRYKDPSGWHFVTLSAADSEFVDDLGGVEIVGLGYVEVTAQLGDSEWQTTLFPDKSGRYLLAIKAALRKREAVVEGGVVDIELTFKARSGETPPST